MDEKAPEPVPEWTPEGADEQRVKFVANPEVGDGEVHEYGEPLKLDDDDDGIPTFDEDTIVEETDYTFVEDPDEPKKKPWKWIALGLVGLGIALILIFGNGSGDKQEPAPKKETPPAQTQPEQTPSDPQPETPAEPSEPETPTEPETPAEPDTPAKPDNNQDTGTALSEPTLDNTKAGLYAQLDGLLFKVTYGADTPEELQQGEPGKLVRLDCALEGGKEWSELGRWQSGSTPVEIELTDDVISNATRCSLKGPTGGPYDWTMPAAS